MDPGWTLLAGGFVLVLISSFGEALGVIDKKAGWLWLGISYVVFTLSAVIWGSWVSIGINGGMAAVSFVMWWRNGGGDDTKRRLRKAKEKFLPTRRTAPVAG